MTEYERYLITEWETYQAHPERFQASLAAVHGRKIYRVLDVGCGAGQELLPFLQALGARGSGVDISPIAPAVARRCFARLDCANRADFHCCGAEALPFPSASFDVVTCRLALPYTRNGQALAEMARVLRPGGLLILKIQHVRYYFTRIWVDLKHGRLRSVAVLVRVLVGGTVYHLTGWQPNNPVLGRQTYQTRWLLNRLLSRVGLVIRSELSDSDSNPRTPVFVIEKTGVEMTAPAPDQYREPRLGAELSQTNTELV